MRPGFRMRRGSKLSLTRALSAASAPPRASTTGTTLRNAAPPPIRAARPPTPAHAARGGGDIGARRAASERRGKVGGSRDCVRRVERCRQGRDGTVIVEAEDHHSSCLLRPRQDLDRDLAQYGEGAERAGHQLAEIIAGDVLHDLAAGLEALAAPAHRGKTEKVVARGTGLEPARPRQIAGEDAAKGLAGGSVEATAPIR